MSANHLKIKNDPRWKKARQRTLTRDAHTCVLCGAADDLTVDHIVSLDYLLKTDGDPFDEDNLRVLCRSCNGRKGNRDTVRAPYIAPNWKSIL